MRALGERLGLPRMGTARPFALAMVIDAVGSGLLLPFSLLYFHYAGGLSLAEAGLGLTVSMLIAVPAPLVGGVPVDHVGPRTVAVATNAARVVGFLGYLLVHDLIALVMVALLVSVSDRLFWVAQPALIGEFAASGSRDRWFGLAITRLLWPAAVSFALAAVLITSLRCRSEPPWRRCRLSRVSRATGRSWLTGLSVGSSQVTWCSGSSGR